MNYEECEANAIDEMGLRVLADALAATDEFGDGFVIEQTGGFVMVGFVYGSQGRDGVHAAVTGSEWTVTNDTYDIQVYADADEETVTETHLTVTVPDLFEWARAFIAAEATR